MKAPERIILGSGYIHLAVFNKGMVIPDPQTFCTDENRYSYIKNGASLEYTNEVQNVKDDMGKVAKNIVTSEEVKLKAGLMTLIGDTIEKLCDTARVSVSQDGKYRTTKIGGVGNRKGAKYVICFHHVDPEDGDIYVMIIGQNQAGFTLQFAPSDATVVDAEFTAMPNLDDEGTLVMYVEEIKEEEPVSYGVTQNLTHVTSSYSGSTAQEGAALEAILSAQEGYTLGSVSVSMGGTDITASAWNSEASKVSIASVTSDVVITASASVTPVTHSITQSLTNVTSSLSDESIADGEALEATLEAESGYTLGEVSVTMGAEDITSTAWDSGTSKVSITSVTGDVVITATASD